jgi:hypothetical protein
LQNLIQTNSKSVFVTIIAWIFIFLSGVAVCFSLVQNIVFNFTAPFNPAEEWIKDPQFMRDGHSLILFMLTNMRIIIFGFLVVSVLAFISSIGLLFRENWARIIFIGVMVLGILWNTVNLIMEGFFFIEFVRPEVNSSEVNAQFDLIIYIIFIFFMLLALSFLTFFGWVVKKLCSPAIRAEFN